jgi:hypothetical protein
VITVGGAGSIDEEFGSAGLADRVAIQEAEPELVGAILTAIVSDTVAASPTPELPPPQTTPVRAKMPAIPRALTPPAGVFASPPRPSSTKSAPPAKAPAAASSAPPPSQRPVIFSPRAAAGPAASPPGGGASSPRPAMPPRPFSGTGAPAPARNASVTPGRAPINPFLANDPNAKARRLARALISDLVTYFPERRDEGLRAGTLRDLFSDEIKKSYEEYAEQVGREFADSTAHFKDALNEILAGGQSMF